MTQQGLYKLDMKDRRILYELDSDARQPCTKIAKKVGLSSEVVNYRIRRLEEEKIITQYQLIVNLSKLNILQFKICLSLQHITSAKLNEIIQALKQNKAVKWIVSCTGNWDLIMSLETESVEGIDSLKNDVLNLFEGFVNKKAISILVEAITYNRDYLVEDKSLINKSRIIMKKDAVVKLDEQDLRILRMLSVDARKPVVEIAVALKTTARVIDYRIRQLMKTGVILGFKVALDYERLGIKFYKAFIYIDNPKNERLKTLVQYFMQHKNIIHHVKVLGNWDFEPEFETISEKEFNDIITDIKDKFSDIIKDMDIISISKEHKFVYF